MENRFDKISTGLSDSDLQERIDNPELFQENAVISAANELYKRNNDPSYISEVEKIKKSIENREEEKKVKSENQSKDVEEHKANIGGELAGFGDRFLAFVIDAVIVFILTFIIGSVIMGIYISMTGITDIDNISNIPFIVFNFLYYALFECTKFQATPGKMVMKLRLVNKDGERITFPKALLRYIAKMLSSIILGLGFLSIFTDLKKRALHDRLSEVYVVKGKRPYKPDSEYDKILDAGIEM